MKRYMEDYLSTDCLTILRKLIEENDKDKINEWRTLNLVTQIKMIRAQAISELKFEKIFSGETYIDTFLKLKNDPEATYESIEDTALLFQTWCKEQAIVPGDFMLNLYAILNKDTTKQNTFILHGASNAGKSYWSYALCPNLDIVGHTVQSQDFA